jgi:tRNA-specific 2-thiouridylase
MSGGVDSSVAAALLKERGYEVVGMMLRLWSEPGTEDSNRCCMPDAMALARRVAARLEIPFYVLDAKEIFRKTVVQSFLDGYARGETPNPCLICNRQIRWTFLLEHALALGADFMATGHYARLVRADDGIMQLRRAVDAAKDQSYVLHVLDQERLRRALFPVGEYPKPEIRKLAESYGLPTSSRRDSQDLCFLAGGDYRDFIGRNGADMQRRGPIIDRDGKVLGEHTGLANYTIGQRKGLGVAGPSPLYVIEKIVASNTIVVGAEAELGTRRLTAAEVNWVSGLPIRRPTQANVKTRYTAREQPATIIPLEEGGQVEVLFEAPQRDITPGQAAVFYQDDLLLGGGIIR